MSLFLKGDLISDLHDNFFVFQRLKPTQIVNVLSLIFNKFALNLIFNANLLD